MKKFRTWYVLEILQGIQQFGHVMSIDRTEVPNLKCFKQVTAIADKTFHAMFQLTGHFAGEVLSDRQFA